MLHSKLFKTLLVLPLLTAMFSPAVLAQTGETASSQEKTQADRVEGEWIVQFKQSKPYAKLSSQALNKLQEFERTEVQNSGQTLLVKGNDDQLTELKKELEKDPEVAFVEPNYRYYTTDVTSKPNDPKIGQQWGLEQVSALQAWDTIRNWNGEMKESVTVAVIDTGIDLGHPDLKNRYIPGYSTLENSPDFTDDVGHGTHVAGIIAADTNNGKGIAGVSGESPVKILPIRALGKQGGTSLTVASGIERAIEAKVDVINLSLGGRGYSQLLRQTIKKATDQGILVVVAAGNANTNTDNYFPAGFSECLTVAAVNEKIKPSSFSNYGSAVDLAAPGEQILSTVLDDQYEQYNGTSMATPFVSAAAALVKLTHPDWGTEEIRNALETSARDIGSSGFDATTGHGLLDVNQAILAQQNVPLQVESPAFGSQVFGKVTMNLVIFDDSVRQVRLSTKEGKLLGTAQVENKRATVTWDTNLLQSGRTSLIIEAFDQMSSKPIGDAREWIVVIRDQEKQGLGISATKPSGEPAKGTMLMLFKKNQRSPIYQGYVNDQGQTFLPKLTLLPGETYGLYATYKDDVTGENYLQFYPVTSKTTSLTIDFGQTHPVQIELMKNGKSLIGNNDLEATLYLNAVSDENRFLPAYVNYQVEIKDGQVVLPRLAPGTYEVELQGSVGNQYHFLLNQKVEITKQNGKITFDLNDASKIDFKLPEWADSMMIAYQWMQAPYLPIRKSGSVFVTKEESGELILLLQQKTKDKVWLYGVNALNLDTTRNRTVDLSKPPVIEYREYEHQKVTGGGYLYIPVDFKLSEDTYINSIYWMNASDWESLSAQHVLTPPASDKELTSQFLTVDNGFVQGDPETNPFYFDGPETYLTDSKGNEVTRWKFAYGSEIPNDSTLIDGIYQVNVDLSKVPLPIAVPRVKICDIEFVQSVPKVTVLDPNGQVFEDADLIVSDPETGEKLAHMGIIMVITGGKNPVLEFPQLVPGKPCRITIFGFTKDKGYVFFDHEMPFPGGHSTLDLSQAPHRPNKVQINWEEKDDSVILSRKITEGDQFLREFTPEFTGELWLDQGTYYSLVMRNSGDKPFAQSKELIISPDSTEIQVEPDYNKLIKVQIEGSKPANTDWLIGTSLQITSEKGNMMFLLKADESQSVYVPADQKEFQVVQSVTVDQGQVITVMDAKSRKSKDGYRLKVGGKLSAKVSAQQQEYAPGDNAEFSVNVSDQYGNKVTNGNVQVDAPLKDLDLPLVLTNKGDHEWELAYYDIQKKEYEKISWQLIEPKIQLKKGDEIVLEESGYSFWTNPTLQLPDDLEPGTYEVVWSTPLPVELIATTQFEVKANKQ
ncbi:S8 family peptidase [Brevibacillus sp. SYSU BS000544]|uniref:S8 family peptidase n=1 Tax=Brevibacillus sp. SYSU BS000544 TaxID=3416443 RepID=UPI003CE55317